MSLHLGNLSTRVSRNEIERVFRRFGRCNVQVKDKFGFVVYDFTADAEKALRTLRGKNICGEPVTLSWSNRQPRPLQSNRRTGSTHESQSGRRRVKEDYGDQNLGSGDRRNYRISDKQIDAGGRRFKSIDLGNEASYCKENVEVYNGQKDHVVGDNLPFDGATMEPMSMDRESERVGQPLNDNGIENGLNFERYDPNYADNKRDDKDDLYNVTFSGRSPTMTKSQEKKGNEKTGDAALKHPDNAKSLATCYNCGKLGHKKRNCPTGEVTNRKVLSRINRRHDDEFYYRGKGKDELRGQRFMSRRVLHRSRSSVPVRKNKSERNESYSKHRMVRRDKYSPLAKEIDRSRREEHQEGREEHQEGKRRRMERQSPDRHQAKKMKVAESSPINSDYTASRSRSPSKSASWFSSQSRLQFSKSASLSSNATSHSRSHCSKFGNSKMTLKSRSSSPASLPSPGSLNQTLPSSPKELQINQKMSLVNSAIQESERDERGQLEGYAGSDDFNLYSARVSGENPSAVHFVQVDDDEDMNTSILDKRDGDHAIIRDAQYGDNLSAIGLDEDPLVAGNLSTQDQNSSAVQSVQMDDDEDMNKSIVDKRDGHHAIIRDSQNGDNLSSLGLDQDRLVAGNLSTQDACVALDHLSLPINNLHSEVSIGSYSSSSLTAEEMNMVLKFYGMEQPEEHVPVEAFFGSARLWPWEIIYYRRLKKGPISVENYARRLSQNNEFGIVDKYIRSSSGWGDLSKDSS